MAVVVVLVGGSEGIVGWPVKGMVFAKEVNCNEYETVYAEDRDHIQVRVN